MLILGARFLAYSTAPDTVAAAAPWVDVLSINPYEWNVIWFALAQSSAVVNGLYPELFLRMAGVHHRMYTERMSLATP